MTEMFGEAWSPMSVPDLAPDDDDDVPHQVSITWKQRHKKQKMFPFFPCAISCCHSTGG